MSATEPRTPDSVPAPEEQYLRQADPVLRAVIDAALSAGDRPRLEADPRWPPDPNMPTDRYGVLVRSIINQNLSNIASRAIYGRLRERFGGRLPTPQEILDADPEELRHAAGFSRAKSASLRSLAEHILSGQLDLDHLHELPDEEVVAQLVAVKGIGEWTADMFLMFHLHRQDVLPAGDLGLRHVIETDYGLAAPPSPKELERIAEPWRPYRTLACAYLWRSAHATPQV